MSNFLASYKKLVSGLLARHDQQKAMSLAVGSDFEAVGKMEYFILLQHGLQKDHTVVDVGCGSGRLAIRLKDYLDGKYLGIDVVPELYEYARKLVGRDDWDFKTAPGLTIPMRDESADFICFFSVFTHLTHEESYKYLEDRGISIVRNVLREEGRAVLELYRTKSGRIYNG